MNFPRLGSLLATSFLGLLVLADTLSLSATAEECGGSDGTIVLQSQRQVDNFNNDYGD